MICKKYKTGGIIMLIYEFRLIGNKLLSFRKKNGLTQSEVAERAGLSDRTYADIERGTVNMRIETILKICDALNITPNEILTAEDEETIILEDEIIKKLNRCTCNEKETALKLLNVYLDSLK